MARQRIYAACDHAPVSYDLVVWDGPAPADDAGAAAEYGRLYMKYIELSAVRPPWPTITEYVQALLRRWPDLGAHDLGETSPWASSGLMSNASGPLLYFGMGRDVAGTVVSGAVAEARLRNLVVYDPQERRVRS